MDDMIEISSINLGDNMSFSNSSMKSTNFGSGVELLMNDKKKESSSHSNDINIDDLNILENELNDLVDTGSSSFNYNPSKAFEGKSDMFNKNISFSHDDTKHSVKFEDTPNIGQATAEGGQENKTWDGFTKFNNVPLNPDKAVPQQPQMNKVKLNKKPSIMLFIVN